MIEDRSQPKPRREPAHEKPGGCQGILYIVGTPIGNPDDLSIRAGRILRSISLVAAEHPAVTRHLLAHHGIHATVTSYGPSHLTEKIAVLIDRLQKGQDIALVVDGGMPAIHDPGQRLISEAHRIRLPVTVIPGPSVVTASLALAGYSGDRFIFAGALPQASRSRIRFLETFLTKPEPVIFLVEPRVLPGVLRLIANVAGQRELALTADITKPGESVWRGTAGSVLQQLHSLPLHAEVALVLGAAARRTRIHSSSKAGGATRRGGGG